MKFVRLVLIIISLGLVCSCTTKKSILYLQDIPELDTSFSYNSNNDYKIRPGDILYVRIYSINRDISDLYNMANTQNNAWNSEMGFYVNGFSVSKDGYLTLPLLGSIEAEGLTIEELQSAVQVRVNESLKGAIAVVKNISYKVTVLGEVAYPGEKLITNDVVNIFQLIGQAGDITLMGDKRNIIHMRINGDVLETHIIDLTRTDLINTPYFNVHPNDIIYVKPRGAKVFQANGPNLSIFLSFISATISVVTLLRLVLA